MHCKFETHYYLLITRSVQVGKEKSMGLVCCEIMVPENMNVHVQRIILFDSLCLLGGMLLTHSQLSNIAA